MAQHFEAIIEVVTKLELDNTFKAFLVANGWTPPTDPTSPDRLKPGRADITDRLIEHGRRVRRRVAQEIAENIRAKSRSAEELAAGEPLLHDALTRAAEASAYREAAHIAQASIETPFGDTPGELVADKEEKGPPIVVFSLRLPAPLVSGLRKLATDRATAPTQLARQWLLQRYSQETTPGAVDSGDMGQLGTKAEADRMAALLREAADVAARDARAQVAEEIALDLDSLRGYMMPGDLADFVVGVARKHATVQELAGG